MSIKRTFRKVANISIPCIIVCDCASPKSDFQRQYYSDACAHQPASICSRATLQSPQVGDEMRLRNSGRSSAHLHVPILLSTLLFCAVLLSSMSSRALSLSAILYARAPSTDVCVTSLDGALSLPPRHETRSLLAPRTLLKDTKTHPRHIMYTFTHE